MHPIFHYILYDLDAQPSFSSVWPFLIYTRQRLGAARHMPVGLATVPVQQDPFDSGPSHARMNAWLFVHYPAHHIGVIHRYPSWHIWGLGEYKWLFPLNSIIAFSICSPGLCPSTFNLNSGQPEYLAPAGDVHPLPWSRPDPRGTQLVMLFCLGGFCQYW